MRVFLLGAGFSKAAGLPLTNELLQELLEDTYIDRFMPDQGRDFINGLSANINSINGGLADTPINLEEFFEYALVESELWRMDSHLKDHEVYAGGERIVVSAIELLASRLFTILVEHEATACMYPIFRFVKHVREDDVVIVFNYDTLVERALDARGVRWHYGFDSQSNEVISPSKSDAGVLVCKMHGSVNWRRWKRQVLEYSPGDGSERLFRHKDINRYAGGEQDGSDHPLRACELWRVENARSPCGPEGSWTKDGYPGDKGYQYDPQCLAGIGSSKHVSQIPGLGVVWHKAYEALVHAQQVVAIGFAMTPYDRMVSLFVWRAAQQRMKMVREHSNTKPELLLVAPDARKLQKIYKRTFPGYRCVKIPQKHENVSWQKLLTH